jgi:hypothetical protein
MSTKKPLTDIPSMGIYQMSDPLLVDAIKDNRLSSACQSFGQALDTLNRMSDALDNIICSDYNITEMSIDQLQELIQKLPKHYKGTRHLYEQIEHIEDNKFKANQHKE